MEDSPHDEAMEKLLSEEWALLESCLHKALAASHARILAQSGKPLEWRVMADALLAENKALKADLEKSRSGQTQQDAAAAPLPGLLLPPGPASKSSPRLRSVVPQEQPHSPRSLLAAPASHENAKLAPPRSRSAGPPPRSSSTPRRNSHMKKSSSSMALERDRSGLQILGAAPLEAHTKSPRRPSKAADAHRVFTDVNEMKQKIRTSVLRQKVKTETELYHQDGFFQKVASHQVFEQLTLLVIAFNSIWIAYETDHNSAETLSDAPLAVQITEHAFCIFFVMEWFARFMAFEQKFLAICNRWMLFDFTLVTTMVIELWVMPLIVFLLGADLKSTADSSNATVLRLFRILRFARIARMARLLRSVPELMIMLKGFAIAARSVAVTIVMLILLLYIYGIGFTQMLKGSVTGSYRFGSVPESMTSLLHFGVLLDSAPSLLEELGSESLVYRVIFLSFIMLANFTILNMLIGVMCETIRLVSEAENEDILVTETKKKLSNMIFESGLDKDGDNLISREEFLMMLNLPEACRALSQLGVDVVGLVELEEFVFANTAALEFSDFMDVVLQLRGSNNATVKDIVDLGRSLRLEIRKLAPEPEPEELANSFSNGSMCSSRTPQAADLKA
eukprot:TRINITY_DN48374_c0_g1_i1.p1 TRINITY_DN48374_c0_g1~~TRINITY_DN48374_c0_g1_i1.p1  ORF type:complete len:621 (-),score=123.57 TRINITY_DN48374_c0_g1_i1:103-1965(-)